MLGTTTRPRVRLVSRPDVPEPEKLSWLVLGRGASDASPGDMSLMLTGQVPSPWFRANQQLNQTSPEIARAVLVDDFASTSPPRWVPPDAADHSDAGAR